jgi:cytochrome c oxidase assembly protein subunit 15
MTANPWLHRYAIFVACCTLFLVVAGATVTSKEAGLSVPDWPLSYGQLMPPMYGNIFYEHGHRMIATFVGMLTIILSLWLWRREDRRVVRIMGWAALGLVCFQGTLGGLTVLLMLPKAISIAHACTAEIFFSLTAAIALMTSPSWRAEPDRVTDSPVLATRQLALWLPPIVFLQVFLGAAFRHKLLPVLWHVAGAVLVTGAVLFATVYTLLEFPRHKAVRAACIALLGIVFCQVFLGVAAYMTRVTTMDAPQPMPVMVWFTVAHVAVGALTLATSVLYALKIHRLVKPAPLLETERAAAAVTQFRFR